MAPVIKAQAYCLFALLSYPQRSPFTEITEDIRTTYASQLYWNDFSLTVLGYKAFSPRVRYTLSIDGCAFVLQKERNYGSEHDHRPMGNWYCSLWLRHKELSMSNHYLQPDVAHSYEHLPKQLKSLLGYPFVLRALRIADQP